MSIVGDAWVVIRAITKNLNKDIKDGLDGAAKDAEASGNRVGESFRKGIFDTFDDDFDRRGNDIGKKLGSAVLSGLGGALSGLASLTAMFALVTGLTGLIGGLIGAVGALAAGAVALTAALGPALVAIGVVGAASLGALLGVIGVGIGIFKQLSDETAVLGKNATGLKESWKGLSAQFKEVFATVGEEKVFGPLNDLVETLGDELFPTLSKAIEGFGGVIGNVITRFNELFENPLFQGSFGTALDAMIGLADSFGSALVDLTAVFVHLIAAAKPAIDMFAGWFRDWASNLRTVTEAGLETGKLGDFMAKAAAKGGQLFDILGNLWTILKNVFKAASPLGGVFLDNFQKATQAVADFTSSAKGAGAVFDFFEPGGQVHRNISAVWGLVKELGKSIATLTQAKGVEDLANGIRRLLPGVTEIVVSAVDAVGLLAVALGNGLNSPEGLNGIKAIKAGLGDLGVAFAKLGPALGPLLGIIGDLASNLAEVLGPAFTALADALAKARPSLDAIGDALGQVLLAAIQAVLPLIVQLLDLVAELATAFAGPLAVAIYAAGDIIGGVITILSPLISLLSKMAPLITAVAAAWGTWKVAVVAAKGVQLFAGTMGIAALGAGKLSPALSGAANAVSKFAAAAPVLAILTVGFTSALSAQHQYIQDLASDLRKGGDAAAEARDKMANPSFWDKFIFNLTHFGNSEDVAAAQTREVNKAMGEQWRAMSDVEQASAKVTEWTATYTARLRDHGAAAADTIVAHRKLAEWTAAGAVANYNVAIASGDYATATDLVANALWREVDAQNAANGALASSQLSAVGAARAAEALAKAQASGDPLEIAGAQAQLNLQLDGAVTSAQNAATEYSKSSEGLAKYGSAAEAMRASLQTQIASLDDLISKTSGPAQQSLIDLRGRLVELSDGTYDTDVNIITDDAMAKVLGLDAELAKVAGTKVTAEIFAATQEADTSISGVFTELLKIDGTRSEAQIAAGTQDATAGINLVLGELFKLDNTSSEAEITAATSEADASIQAIIYKMMGVDATTATPEIQAQVADTQAKISDIVGKLLGLDLQTANPDVVLDSTPAVANAKTITEALLGIDTTTAVPTVTINPAPFNGIYSDLTIKTRHLDRERPIPTASLNADPFNSILTKSLLGVSNLAQQKPTPIVTLIDRASGVAAAVQNAINSVTGKTVTLTTIQRTIREGQQAAGRGLTAAGGGRINEDSWTTVGEEGRELVFLSQGQYVATYQKAKAILAAASMQAAGIASGMAGTTALTPVSVATGGGISIPITVNPSAEMDELGLARKTGREFAFQFRKIT